MPTILVVGDGAALRDSMAETVPDLGHCPMQAADQAGFFREAGRGTLLPDEISDLDMAMQAQDTVKLALAAAPPQ